MYRSLTESGDMHGCFLLTLVHNNLIIRTCSCIAMTLEWVIVFSFMNKDWVLIFLLTMCFNCTWNHDYLSFLCSPPQSENANVTLNVNPCRPGYALQMDEGGLTTCVCVGAEENPLAVLSCDHDNNAVLLWVSSLLMSWKCIALLSWVVNIDTNDYIQIRIRVQYCLLHKCELINQYWFVGGTGYLQKLLRLI